MREYLHTRIKTSLYYICRQRLFRHTLWSREITLPQNSFCCIYSGRHLCKRIRISINIHIDNYIYSLIIIYLYRWHWIIFRIDIHIIIFTYMPISKKKWQLYLIFINSYDLRKAKNERTKNKDEHAWLKFSTHVMKHMDYILSKRIRFGAFKKCNGVSGHWRLQLSVDSYLFLIIWELLCILRKDGGVVSRCFLDCFEFRVFS